MCIFKYMYKKVAVAAMMTLMLKRWHFNILGIVAMSVRLYFSLYMDCHRGRPTLACAPPFSVPVYLNIPISHFYYI